MAQAPGACSAAQFFSIAFMVAGALTVVLVWIWYNAYREVGVLEERAESIERLIKELTGSDEGGEDEENSDES